MSPDPFCLASPVVPALKRPFGFLSVVLVLSVLSLTSCSLFESSKDKDDKPPKRREHNYRDAVEQRVFYDGFWER